MTGSTGTPFDTLLDEAEPVAPRGRRVVVGVLKLVGLCALGGMLAAGVLFPLAGGAGTVAVLASDDVDRTAAALIADEAPQMTALLDSEGRPFAHVYDQYRVPVPAAEISDSVKSALVAIEDHRFYDHQGVDPVALGRAALANAVSGRISQGGSTLTQQYVKNHLTHISAETAVERTRAQEQSMARKVRELRIALQLEHTLSKDEILARYLNTVPFGQGAFGIQAAARAYFDTTQDKLTVAQAALLAGIVNEPSALNPYRHPERALVRRNVVLDEMVRQGRLPAAVGAAEKKTNLDIVPTPARPANGCVGTGDAGYFCDYALKYLENSGFQRDDLRRGGYTIKTTLDRDALTKAKAAVDDEVPPQTRNVANAMAIVQPGKDKHRVIALTANRTYGLNRDARETTLGLPYAPQNHGAGSIYKMFTAAALLEQGGTITESVPVPDSYVSPVFLGGAASCPPGALGLRKYCVQNAGEYPARMSLQDALAKSPNTTFVHLLERVGVKAAVDMAQRLGLRTLGTMIAAEDRKKRPIGRFFAEQNFGSFTLGPTPTSTLELANVGATLASEGKWCPPSPIETVLDRRGNPVPVRDQACEQVVQPGLANAMTVALSKDTLGGTATTAARGVKWDRPMAGKTGTTQEHKSAGFLGFTPQLSAAVFTFDDTPAPQTLCDSGVNQPPRPCSSGRYIYGGKYSARTWFRAMNGDNGHGGIMSGMPVAGLPEVERRYLHSDRPRPVDLSDIGDRRPQPSKTRTVSATPPPTTSAGGGPVTTTPSRPPVTTRPTTPPPTRTKPTGIG
ncbi:transglycosylase domain-containing protein [Crossiella sp. CA198]|uniref:transglycosylase domain-containing protein n=1 Tax=Crossiella sp. CA198 TaxID=3455607 RepID=UPI003F8D2954